MVLFCAADMSDMSSGPAQSWSSEVSRTQRRLGSQDMSDRKRLQLRLRWKDYLLRWGAGGGEDVTHRGGFEESGTGQSSEQFTTEMGGTVRQKPSVSL